MARPMRIAMLVSGGGTTMDEIIASCKEGLLNGLVEPALVIASRPDAGGIEKAIRRGMDPKDVIVLERKAFPDPFAWGEEMLKNCKARGVDLVGQYGWLPLTPANVIGAYRDMMVNQHPGPLDPGRPDFGGRWMMGRAVHAARLLFVRETDRGFWTEASAQRVAEEYDKGTILGTLRADIEKGDDVNSLQQKVLPLEHQLQIDVLAQFVRGIVKEIVRDEPLVLPSEEPILREAKRIAHLLYPNG